MKLNRENEVTCEVMKQFRAPAACFSREKVYSDYRRFWNWKMSVLV